MAKNRLPRDPHDDDHSDEIPKHLPNFHSPNRRTDRYGLTQTEQRFVRAFVRLGSGVDAYFEATGGECKRTSAATLASRLLALPYIQRAVERYRKEIASREDITEQKIRRELARIGFSDPADLYDKDGNLKPIHEMSDQARAIIESIETEEIYEGRGKDRKVIGTAKRVKLWNKLGALGKLAEMTGLISPKGAVTVNNTQINVTGIDLSKYDLPVEVLEKMLADAEAGKTIEMPKAITQSLPPGLPAPQTPPETRIQAFPPMELPPPEVTDDEPPAENFEGSEE